MEQIFETIFQMKVSDITTVWIIAQIISVFTIITSVVSAQFKKLLHILACELLANVSVAVTYLLLGGSSGAFICLAASVQLIISCIYNYKEKSMPVWMTAVFIAIYAVISFSTYKSWLDIIAFACSVLFALAIVAKNPIGYRIFMLINSVLWLVYSYMVKGYVNMITYILLIISLTTAMIRLDFKKNKPVETDAE